MLPSVPLRPRDAAVSPSKDFVGQNWLDLDKILLNLRKIEAKFGQKWLDLGKLRTLNPKNNAISSGYASIHSEGAGAENTRFCTPTVVQHQGFQISIFLFKTYVFIVYNQTFFRN